MLTRKEIQLFLLICLLGTTLGARKPIKNVKPVKTFPRSNVTPTPQTTNLSMATSPLTSSSNTQFQQPSSTLASLSALDETLSSKINAVTDLPKPLSSHQSLPASIQSDSTTNEYKEPVEEMEEDCEPDMIGFELITGYVLSAPSKLLETQPGTLMLTDCLEACQNNESCSAVNYETGLCVLFSTTADKLPGSLSRSQFPVFTIYAQKQCLGIRPCTKGWCIDRVQGHRLTGHVRRSHTVFNRRDCLELCIGETEFICRSANFYSHSGLCELSEMDRITLAGSNSFDPYDGADYLENNCAEEPNKLCEFKRISGKILKTVDSVYQDIASIEDCRELCLGSPYRCHSYDYNDTGDMVCRLSHHSRATLTDVNDPYLDVPEAATYELSSCYNVSIECKAGEMITKIRTSKLFDGKVYAKGAPKSCSLDVKNALDFDFRMGYNDLECNVKQSAYGRYVNDIVIQHHDMIVTSADLGLAVSCQYDLTNKTVSNDVDLGVTGDIEPSMSEEIFVDSPNVIMKITSRDGNDIKRSAEVGDPLALKFEILDQESPYEIFVRELVALDGTDNAEITLIDSNGCPTDQFIMGPIYKTSFNRKVLLTHFDAFKFPSSEVVQFRALVTPCMPRCEPVQCEQEDLGSGELKSLVSYGRKRRSVNVTTDFARWRRDVKSPIPQDDMLLEQSIQITDKFGFDHDESKTANTDYHQTEKIFTSSELFGCLNGYGFIIAGLIFLLGQIIIIAIWKHLQYRYRKEENLFSSNSSFGSTSSVIHAHPQQRHKSSSSGTSSPVCSTRNDALSKLYASGMQGRYGQQF